MAPGTQRKFKKGSAPSGAALTAAAILGFDDMKVERVNVPEWQGHVYVRPMTAGERDAFDLFVTENRGNAMVRAYIVALCAVDANGVRLFTREHVEALDKKASLPMTRIFAAARKINKLFYAEVEDAGKN